jgi:hypothetical protein
MAHRGRDELVPDKIVMAELGVGRMTLHRWGKDPNLNFPPKVKIRQRNYRSRRKFEAFKANLIRAGGDAA